MDRGRRMFAADDHVDDGDVEIDANHVVDGEPDECQIPENGAGADVATSLAAMLDR